MSRKDIKKVLSNVRRYAEGGFFDPTPEIIRQYNTPAPPPIQRQGSLVDGWRRSENIEDWRDRPQLLKYLPDPSDIGEGLQRLRDHPFTPPGEVMPEHIGQLSQEAGFSDIGRGEEIHEEFLPLKKLKHEPQHMQGGGVPDEGESWEPPPEPLEAGYPEPKPTTREIVTQAVRPQHQQPLPRPEGTGEQYVESRPLSKQEQLQQMLEGEHPSYLRKRMAEGLAGAAGFVLPPLAAEHALQHEGLQEAAIAGMPGIGKLGKAAQAENVAKNIFSKKGPETYQFKGDPFKQPPAPAETAQPAKTLEQEMEELLKPQYKPAEPPSLGGPPQSFHEHYDLHPQDVQIMKPIGGKMGTGEGGQFFDPYGDKWYIKTPHDPELALNEKLAAELYRRAGVNVADTRLTELNGKLAIASRMIPDVKQFSQYPFENGIGLKGLHEGFPADVWLANGDTIGAGMENPKGNVLYDKHGNAYRIDFGGAMRFGGLGGPKSWWGPKVNEFETFAGPNNKNKTMNSVFNTGTFPPDVKKQIFLEQKQVAQNIANISDQDLYDLVGKYGPNSPVEANKLWETLKARRDQVAEHYGVKFNGDAAYQAKLAEMDKPQPKAKENVVPLSKPVPLMNLNKTHSIPQIFGAIGKIDPTAVSKKVVTDKQMQKIKEMLQNYHDKAPESFVDFLQKLPNEQQMNIQKWMGKPLPKPANSELADMIHKLKNDPAGLDDGHDMEQAMQFFHQYEPKQISDALLDAQLTSKQLNNLFTWIPSSMEKAVDDGLVPGGMLFEKTFSKALQSKKNPEYSHEEQKHVDEFLKQMQEHAAKPYKSPQLREADRIKGGFTQEAYTGRKREKGIERADLRSHEVFQVPPENREVAQAYAAWEDGAHQMQWWDPHHHDWKNNYGTMQKVWLDTSEYVKVDAAQGAYGSYGHGNMLAMQAKEDYKKKYGKKPKGAIIYNTHDMPGGGPIPGGKPITTIITWDQSTRRSAWARFDPEHFGQTGLHLGVAGTMLGGWALVDPKGRAFMLGHLPDEQQEGMKRGGRTMPLAPGSSKATVSKNISEFHTGKTYAHTAAKFGKAKADKQAIAVALSNARKYKASGGAANLSNMELRGSSIKLGREGLLNSSVPGRTDKLPLNLKAGSYILPADIPSALGQGNTLAGGEILKKMFTSGPYGLSAMKGRGSGQRGKLSLSPQKLPKKDGGETDSHVPIIAAGGEYIIPPEAVAHHAGGGDLKKGHDALDRFVVKTRKKYAKTLNKLPGPKK